MLVALRQCLLLWQRHLFGSPESAAVPVMFSYLRHFTAEERHTIFKLDSAALKFSETRRLLLEQQLPQPSYSPEVEAHVKWLEEHPLCAGTNDMGVILRAAQDPKSRELLRGGKALGQEAAAASAAAALGQGRGGMGWPGEQHRQQKDAWAPGGYGYGGSAGSGQAGDSGELGVKTHAVCIKQSHGTLDGGSSHSFMGASIMKCSQYAIGALLLGVRDSRM